MIQSNHDAAKTSHHEKGCKGCFMCDEKLLLAGCCELNLDELTDPGTQRVPVYHYKHYDSFGLPHQNVWRKESIDAMSYLNVEANLCGLHVSYHILLG